MASLSDVTATADAFGKTQYDLGVTEGKRQQSATDDPIIADLRAQLGQTNPPPPPPPTTTTVSYVEATNFTAMSGTAGFAPAGSLTTGKPPASTVYRVKAHTSTKADPTAAGSTNEYRIMRVGGNDASHVVTGLEISGFTVQGTDQLPTMKAYGGCHVGYSTGAHVHDLVVTGIPGYSSSPPGETMSLSFWHANTSLVENVVCDGRVGGTGTAGVAATLFSRSSQCKGNVYKHCTARYASAGFGATSYICFDETWEDSVFDHNRKHLNIERTYGGTYTYRRCKFSNAQVPYVAQVSTDPAYGSAKVIFEDCTVDGDGILRVRVYGPSTVNSQKDADIRCIKNGVDVTSDATKFLLVRSG